MMTFSTFQKHGVVSMSADTTGRWLAVADSGTENVIMMWDLTNRYMIIVN